MRARAARLGVLASALTVGLLLAWGTITNRESSGSNDLACHVFLVALAKWYADHQYTIATQDFHTAASETHDAGMAQAISLFAAGMVTHGLPSDPEAMTTYSYYDDVQAYCSS